MHKATESVDKGAIDFNNIELIKSTSINEDSYDGSDDNVEEDTDKEDWVSYENESVTDSYFRND